MNLFCLVMAALPYLTEIPEENRGGRCNDTAPTLVLYQISFPLHNGAELVLTQNGWVLEGLIYAVGFYYKVIFSVSFQLPGGSRVWLHDSFSMTRHNGQT